MPYYDGAWNTVFTDYDYRMQNASGAEMQNDGAESSRDLEESSGASAHSYQQPGPIAGEYAIDFDGSTYFRTPVAYAASSDNLEVGSTQGTIAAWIKPGATSTLQVIFRSSRDTSPYNKVSAYIDTSNRLQFQLYNGSLNYYRIQDSGDGSYINTTDGQWHLVVWRQKADGTGIELWVDGVAQATFDVNLSSPWTLDSWQSQAIGGTGFIDSEVGYDAGSASGLWTGSMAGIGWSDVAASDANIAALWNESGLGNPFGSNTKTKRRTGRRLYTNAY